MLLRGVGDECSEPSGGKARSHAAEFDQRLEIHTTPRLPARPTVGSTQPGAVDTRSLIAVRASGNREHDQDRRIPALHTAFRKRLQSFVLLEHAQQA